MLGGLWRASAAAHGSCNAVSQSAAGGGGGSADRPMRRPCARARAAERSTQRAASLQLRDGWIAPIDRWTGGDGTGPRWHGTGPRWHGTGPRWHGTGPRWLDRAHRSMDRWGCVRSLTSCSSSCKSCWSRRSLRRPMWTPAQHRPPPRPRPTPLPAARIRACARAPRAVRRTGGPSPGPMWRGRVLDRCGGAESWTDVEGPSPGPMWGRPLLACVRAPRPVPPGIKEPTGLAGRPHGTAAHSTALALGAAATAWPPPHVGLSPTDAASGAGLRNRQRRGRRTGPYGIRLRIGAGQAVFSPATSALRLGPPPRDLHRDWARPCHICTGTGRTAATSASGLGPTCARRSSPAHSPCSSFDSWHASSSSRSSWSSCTRMALATQLHC